MGKYTLILGLILLMTSCSLFNYKERQAIEICQKAKAQISSDNDLTDLFLNALIGPSGLGNNATWLDYAVDITKNDVNKYSWKAEKTNDPDVYLVSFADEKNWGYRWEVDISQKIVKFVNADSYLSRKYGLSQFDSDGTFEIIKIIRNSLKTSKSISYYSGNQMEVLYEIKASVINKSDKTFTDADISGTLQVSYKDKTVNGRSNWDSGFKIRVSNSKPWKPNEEKVFYIRTTGIESIYLDYVPEYVFFTIKIEAEDPVGFKYNKDVAEFDLKNDWSKLNKIDYQDSKVRRIKYSKNTTENTNRGDEDKARNIDDNYNKNIRYGRNASALDSVITKQLEDN